MNIEECLQKRLLKRIALDSGKSESSLRIAEHKLLHAKDLFSKDFFSDALVNAYTAMFHAARAILYHDGFQEKGHYAVYVYLSELYSQKLSPGLIESFLVYQGERHNALYGFEEEISAEDCSSALEDAEHFLMEVEKLYGKH